MANEREVEKRLVIDERESVKRVKELERKLERWRIRDEVRRILFGHLSVTEIVELNEELKKRITELELLVNMLMEDYHGDFGE